MLFGAVTTRRAGIVFALISLGVGELVFAAMCMLQGFSGGEEGITANRTAGPHPFGLTFASQLQVYYVTAFWAVVAAALMARSCARPWAACATPCATIPSGRRSSATTRVRVRWIVFSVAAMFAGLAGGLHALNYEIVAAEAVGAGAPVRCC